MMQRSNTPIAVVEAVDPIVLDARIMDCCCKRDCDCDLCEIPTFVGDCFGGELSSGDDSRRIYVTLGQFSIVRLERDTQLLVPVYDYCMPDKECACGDGCEDPPALCSGTSPSRWASSSRPTPSSGRRAATTSRAAASERQTNRTPAACRGPVLLHPVPVPEGEAPFQKPPRRGRTQPAPR